MVSDNDGSAFITKAEFDSLKNDFQSQIDQYNTSIDNKIDSAIASYLSGVKVEKVSELDSILNKVNDKCEDFYLDASGNKVKYGFRAMARTFNVPTTQKPYGAITNFFISRSDTPDLIKHGWARFALTYNKRTAFGDVTIPYTGYKTGIYFLIDENDDHEIFSMNELDEMEYRFYVGGSSFTHGIQNQGTVDTATNCSLSLDGPFKNENTFWSMARGQAAYTYDHQATDHSYDSWRCIYGTSFNTTKLYMTMPVCGTTDSNVIAVRKTNIIKMTLQESTFVWNLYYTVRTVYDTPDATFFRYDNSPWATGGMAPDGDERYNGMPIDASFPWTFYFNCHPYETINTKNLIDDTATTLLGKKVKITDGIPIFKATNDGVVDMKIKFVKPTSSSITQCGATFRNEVFDNTYFGYNYSSSLNVRDFDDNRYTTNMWDIDKEYNVRMDVKKNDIIYVKAVDTTNQYGVVGAKTTQIKLTEED